MIRAARPVFLFVAIALCVPALLAQQGGQPASDPLTGEWDAIAHYDNPVTFTLSLKLEGTTVTGTIATPEGSAPLRNPKWENETFSFETLYMGAPVVLSAKVKEGKLEGDWSYNGGEAVGRWEATRKA